MVYNAMKLFMEINPQLFDDCSHDYTELQNSAEQRQQARQSKWDKLAEQAKQREIGALSASVPPLTTSRGAKTTAPIRIDQVEPLTQDNQKRLDALKIQDEGSTGRERRPKDHETQNSVGSSRQ